MVDVRPFRGLRYRLSAVSDLSLVISPPYDVVQVDQRGALYQRSPFNIIRLEYGLSFPDDTVEDNVYTRAAEIYHRWRAEGVLGEEASPAFYVLEEAFTYRGRRYIRRGLLGAVRLEPYERRVVFPHEHTSPGPKEDRLRLLQATRASFSPILGLYRGSPAVERLLQEITHAPPQVEARGWEDISYRLWVVWDREVQRAIRGALADKPIYLADGHHRYETALAYEALQQSALSPDPDGAHHAVPMCLVALNDPGLVVDAFHRLVAPLPSDGRRALLAQQERLFTSEEVSWPLTLENGRALLERLGKEESGVGFADGEMGLLRLLRVREDTLAGRAPHPALLRCAPWVLHEGLLGQVWGERGALPEGSVAFVHDLEEVFRRLQTGKASLAYLLRPIPWDVFLAVVEAGIRLPPKSTYFYPKLPAGLVIYPLEGRLPAP